MKVVFWLLAILVLFDGFVQGYEEDSNRKNKITQIRDHLTQKRQIGSTAGRVMRIIDVLMKGTKEVPTKSQYYQKFVKEGTKDDALDDFLSAKLDGIRRSTTTSRDPVTDGNIGPVLFRLNTSDRRQYNRPSITIQDKKKTMNFKIVYYDKMPK